jgi:hypothetical protein
VFSNTKRGKISYKEQKKRVLFVTIQPSPVAALYHLTTRGLIRTTDTQPPTKSRDTVPLRTEGTFCSAKDRRYVLFRQGRKEHLVPLRIKGTPYKNLRIMEHVDY